MSCSTSARDRWTCSPTRRRCIVPLVRRDGRDLTIVSYSRHALLSQEAAVELAKEGIEAEVIDLTQSQADRLGHLRQIA